MTIRRRRGLALAALFGALLASGSGPGLVRAHQPGEQEYLARVWQTDEGLPQNTVRRFVQTQDGYLWLGTFNGLVRFDGIKFTTFLPANTPGLAGDSITALLEDRTGRLWIGHESSGLTVCQDHVFKSSAGPAKPGAGHVTALAEDATGEIWVGTLAGLYRYHGAGYGGDRLLPGQEDPNEISHMCLDQEGHLWITAMNGLFRVDDGKVVREPRCDTGDAVAADRAAGVWVGNRSLGLVHLTPQGMTNYPVFAGVIFTCLYHARNGDVWVGSRFTGLSRLRNGQRTDYGREQGLMALDINALAEDREGNLWVGSNGGGLHRLQENQVQSYSTRNGLFGNDVVCLLQDRAGQVWLGTYGEGVMVLQNGAPTRVSGLPGHEGVVYSLCETRDGSVWLGTPQGQLYRWKDGQVSGSETIEGQGARVIFEDREGALWLGSRTSGVRRRGQNGEQHYFLNRGLSDNYVTGIVQDREGAIWVGTKRGLNRVFNGQVQQFFPKDGLGEAAVQALYVDRESTLWIGTASGGLTRRKQGRFATVTTRQGLINDVVAQIIEDDHGYFWLGSNAGIMRVSRANLEECLDGRSRTIYGKVFNRNEGLLNPECAGAFQPTCFKSSDGRLWFATVGGVVVIDPARLAINPAAAVAHLESISADGEMRLQPADPLSAATGVNIPPGRSRIEIAYTGLSFAAPERVRFRSRLAGLEPDWVEVGTHRTAVYTQLRPGRYVFEVMACNSEGQWNSPKATATLYVQPFWWQTLWFKAALALALAGTGTGTGLFLHRRRLRRELDAAQRRQERDHAEQLAATNVQLLARTKELEEAHASVRILRGLIPICSNCRKVRDDQGFWQKVEEYVMEHSEAKFTHGLCPDCLRRLYPDYAERILDTLDPRTKQSERKPAEGSEPPASPSSGQGLNP